MAAPMPLGLSEELLGYEWRRNISGKSGGAVYRLFDKPGAPDRFLKHGRNVVADDLFDEVSRLRWMASYIPVPQILHFISVPGDAWLLMEALPGKSASEALKAQPENRIVVVDALAAFLRRLHSIPTGECPFNSDHTYRLGLARQRINAGLVEQVDFDEERKGWTAEQVWDAMHQLLPFVPDPVVTHGDFTLDNLLIMDGEVVGCIDVGRAGIADRYQDLAILWNSLGEFGASLQDRFLAEYGTPNPDQNKFQFHLLLDELF